MAASGISELFKFKKIVGINLKTFFICLLIVNLGIIFQVNGSVNDNDSLQPNKNINESYGADMDNEAQNDDNKNEWSRLDNKKNSTRLKMSSSSSSFSSSSSHTSDESSVSSPIFLNTSSEDNKISENEVLPGIYFKSEDIVPLSNEGPSYEHNAPLYTFWDKKTRPSTKGTTTVTPQYHSVTAKYLYTRRIITFETEVTTERHNNLKLLSKEEHLRIMSESYQEYIQNYNFNDKWKDVILGNGKVHFGVLDLRVGRITQVMTHPNSLKLYICDVDIGIGKPVQAVISVAKNMHISDLVMRWIVALCNLAPNKIMGVESNLKIISAVSQQYVDLIYPPVGTEPGDLITVRGYPRNPYNVLDPTTREYPIIARLFNTNNISVVCYRGIPWEVKGKGFVNAFNMPRKLVR